MDITLEDVETAIKVLNAYYRQHKRAQLALARINRMEGAGQKMPRGMNDFMNMAFQTVQQKRQSEGVSPEVEASAPSVDLSDEELQRLRKIKDEMRAKG